MRRCGAVLGILFVAAVACSSLRTSLTRGPASGEASAPDCIGEPFVYPAGDPESAIAPLVKRVSDDELVARLVYAESLASRCLDLYPREAGMLDDLTGAIAWTVWNRVRSEPAKGFGTGAHEVVLRRGQFRSTFGGCDVAKRREFLCPNPEDALWSAAVRSVERAKSGRGNPLSGVHHYFFSRHFDESKSCAKWKGVLPSWAKGVRPAKEISGCAEFYRI